MLPALLQYFILTHTVLTATLWGGWCVFRHVTNEKSVACHIGQTPQYHNTSKSPGNVQAQNTVALWELPRGQERSIWKVYPQTPTRDVHRKDWWWSWSCNTLTTWCQGPTHWKRPWCWEWLRAGEGDDRGWDGWMASPTQWTWFWVSSGRWWRTGKPGVPQSVEPQRVRHDWATEQQ